MGYFYEVKNEKVNLKHGRVTTTFWLELSDGGRAVKVMAGLKKKKDGKDVIEPTAAIVFIEEDGRLYLPSFVPTNIGLMVRPADETVIVREEGQRSAKDDRIEREERREQDARDAAEAGGGLFG